VILDTHVFLWMNQTPEKLSKKIRAVIEKQDTELYFSAASALEISIKCNLNKLRLPTAPEIYIAERIASNNLNHLPISTKHALMAGTFSMKHKDPFDRLLAAQAIIEDLPLLTIDKKLDEFPCAVLWAV